MHAIEHAELPPNSQCLDISTGLGLLPFMLENMGHTCDATDVSPTRRRFRSRCYKTWTKSKMRLVL